MACIRAGENHAAGPRQTGLAFSIDKIIGVQSDSKQCTTKEYSESNKRDKKDEVESSDTLMDTQMEQNSFQENILQNKFNENCQAKPDVKENGTSNKRCHSKNEDTHLKGETNNFSSDKTRAIMHDMELQNKHKQVYQAGEFQDINMNLMSYLHPAFLLGRINPEDYRTHVLQNYYLNQNAHIGRDSSYALDLYKIASSQYFNSPLSLDFKKQYQLESLKMDEPIQQNIYELDQKPKSSVQKSDLSVNTIDKMKDSDDNNDKVFKDGGPEMREKKLPSNQTRLPGNQTRNQKTFTCPECGKIFNAHYNLTRHMPVHTGG